MKFLNSEVSPEYVVLSKERITYGVISETSSEAKVPDIHSFQPPNLKQAVSEVLQYLVATILSKQS